MPKAAKPAAAKKEKKVKDPNAPKKPLGAYMFFCADKRPDIRKAHPTWTLPEVAKALGEAWGKVRCALMMAWFLTRACLRRPDDGLFARAAHTQLPVIQRTHTRNSQTTHYSKVTETDKKKYEKQAEADKARYAKAIAAYEKTK